MSIEWTIFKGKKILSCSYQDAKTEGDQIKQLEKQMSLIEQVLQPVLLLVNLEGTMMTQAGAEFAKKHLAENPKVLKIAVVGASGLKAVIAQGIGRKISDSKQEMFANLDEAKAWLVG